MGGFDRTNGLDDLFLKWNFTSTDRLYGLHYSEINRGSSISAFCQDYRGWKFCFFSIQTFCFLISSGISSFLFIDLSTLKDFFFTFTLRRLESTNVTSQE